MTDKKNYLNDICSYNSRLFGSKEIVGTICFLNYKRKKIKQTKKVFNYRLFANLQNLINCENTSEVHIHYSKKITQHKYF